MSYSYYITKSTGHFVSVMNTQINQTVTGFLSLVSVGSQLLNAATYVVVALVVAPAFGLMAAVLGVATILLFRRVNALARLLSRQTANEQTQLSGRSEEHTSELQSLMRISYAVFCLKKKK